MRGDPEIREVVLPTRLVWGLSLWRGAIYLGARRPMPQIIEAVAKAYGVSEAALRSPCRIRKLVIPRHHAMWLMAQQDHLSLPIIGRFFGVHHTTVMSGRDVHAARLAEQQLEMAA